MKRETKTIRKDEQPDKELINSFLNNDLKAFDKLVLKYQNLVFNVCYRFLGNYDDADDSAQDIFLKVFQYLNTFKFDSSFSTWLYRITINTCKNKISSLEYRFKKKLNYLDKPNDNDDFSFKKEIKDETYSPTAFVEKKEQQFLVQQAINSLPAKQKAVVVLRDIEGLSYEEIISVTGLKLGTVKSKLARARNSLRKKLKEVIKNGL